jgi:hypothetical protein
VKNGSNRRAREPSSIPCPVLGPNLFADTLNLTFASADAVGFDVFPGLISGNILISLFNANNGLLGSFTIFAPVGGTFFGAISEGELIGRIDITSLTAAPGELVDNVAFGTVVPEPATLVLLGTGLAATAAARRSRRRR